jgi:hypothetical protein
MRRFLLTLLAVLVILGGLAGAGFAGYRFGYQQGALAASDGEITIMPFRRGDDFGLNRMPMHEFGWGMRPGFQRGFGEFGIMGRGRGWGFGIFPLFGLLVQLAILGFIVWLVYKLLTGWRLSLTPRSVPESSRVEPARPVESKSTTDETSG